MNILSFILVTTSAFLLQSAFMWGEQCAWMAFIFLMPLLYSVVRCSMRRPFLTGLWWGLIFFTSHFSALLVVLHEKAQGSLRLVAGAIFIVYCALHVGLWFSINAWIARGRSEQIKVFFWSVGAWFYFYWLCNFILWPCGHLVGYCFGSPLIALTGHPYFLSTVGSLGSNILLLFLIGIQASSVLFFISDTRYGIIILVCVTPFCLRLLNREVQIIPHYVSELCYVKPPPKRIFHPYERAEEINMCITRALQLKPAAQCILMPESSFAHCLNTFPEIIELWGTNSLAQGNTLCIGSYRADTYNEYNTLYKIERCRITSLYDKSFLMPFVEYIPNFGKNFSYIRDLFLKSYREFSPKKRSPEALALTDALFVQPLICSDIYMEPYMHCLKKTTSIPILLIVNDSWFSCLYAQRLMFLYAVYYAMCHKRDILYIGYSYGCWINHITGKTILL